MSIARVVTIFHTTFTDFTYNTDNFCWPLLEYGVAILVCCGPLLRPIFEKMSLNSIRSHLKEGEKSSSSTSFPHAGRLGFGQLGAGEMPLQSMAAPSSFTSITGNVAQNKGHATLEDEISKNTNVVSKPERSDLPARGIIVEMGWNIHNTCV